MLKLNSLLAACQIPLNTKSYKIHLATASSTSPLEAFFAGRFQQWQEDQSQRNFQREMVIGLIALRRHRWLFAGVYKVLGVARQSNGKFVYATEMLSGQEEIVGRVVVAHERKSRQAYLNGLEDGGEFYVCEMYEQKLSIEEFPGYNAIQVSYSKLKIIMEQRVQSWHGALSNVKGVYLITDRSTGKLYVGSAIGNLGIWERWSSYVCNGHGGNEELKKMLVDLGSNHCQHFQFTVLEIADTHASDDYILSRESHWKNILMSRTFGLNAN